MHHQEVPPAFVAAIDAGLAYWRRLLDDPTRHATVERERANVYRAVAMGLDLPQTAPAAATLASGLYRIVERHGDWLRWRPLLERCRTAAPDPATRLELTIHLGQLQMMAGDITAAIDTNRAAAAAADAHGDTRRLAIAHAHLGEAFRLQGDLDAAWHWTSTAQAAAERLSPPDTRIFAATHHTLGVIARARGDHATAVAHYDAALAGWQALNDTHYFVRTMTNRGVAQQRAHLWDAALESYRAALAALGTIDAPVARARVYLNMSGVYQRQGAAEDAIRCLHEADRWVPRHAGFLHLRAQIANNMGLTMRKQGRFDEAIGYLQTAIKFWRALDNQTQLGNSVGELGIAHARRGDALTARARLSEAVALLSLESADKHALALREEMEQELRQLDPAGSDIP